MTTATTTLSGNDCRKISKRAPAARKPLADTVFHPRDAVLHHAVDVHDQQEQAAAERPAKSALEKLNDALYSAFKGFFDAGAWK